MISHTLSTVMLNQKNFLLFSLKNVKQSIAFLNPTVKNSADFYIACHTVKPDMS